ncbi:hypothetical protein IP90_02233 [Luteimonas cucumeris]|uniref:DUF4124 domain-containing protein n=1 Tax=Luteimonas cucumeris TaxID=985012 RepID=A0A562L2I4_9GAMM|nr:DUF4124 domain-containing protein [Luteimonas cucumeris]TWI01674.1 hypothetical protein IP90_02233 [Luteimonas cucumeris]
MLRIAFAVLAILASDLAGAQRIFMYRCTDAAGAVTLQNDVPCPKGHRQEKHVVEAPPPPVDTSPAATDAIPATAAAPSAAAPLTVLTSVDPAPTADATAATTATDAAAPVPERGPPPTLYRCGYQGNDTYFADSAEPPRRCLALQALGLDGNPDTGAGQACEMIQDRCEPVADDRLCDAWQQRLRDAEAAVQNAAQGQTESATAELERIKGVVDASVCGR